MFERILIANRGEIACRIIETARKMGVSCVAVHSDIDKHARHVEMADHAVLIGGAAPAESYLRGDAIIEAALATGAEAIHPGYGFLSENPEFVEAVEAAGLVFIGPSAHAIRSMGLKDAAKALMIDAGVPVVPGVHGGDQSPDVLQASADEIGYPVLIKAVAGGGGKGMRLVERREDFDAALTSARSEAQNAFGNGDVLVEKFIQNPRHIEVQVFGDGARAVHLFERDCSLQRRHQKVIEEAPAPGMTPQMRAAMGEAAVRAAEAIGYKGAGTVEFIADGSEGLHPERFYFMEMNTRLQVEHPVTELITGVDLVDWQLRVASGDPLALDQDALNIHGHAFEARLYAEDAQAGFLPATGKLSHLHFPKGVRADTGVRAGDEITPFYDPMIAKVIVHAEDRGTALRRLHKALLNCEIAGSVTNLAFLGALAEHQGFRDGDFDTGLIGRDLAVLTRAAAPAVSDWVAAGMAALDLDDLPEDAGFTLWQPLSQRVTLSFAEETRVLTVTVLKARTLRWSVGEDEALAEQGGEGWRVAGVPLTKTHRSGSEVTVFAQYGLRFLHVDPLDVASGENAHSDVVTAPMPGRVMAIYAKPGQPVTAGERLAVLEAMKMEHTLLSPRAGVVEEVLAAEGDQVGATAPLIALVPEEEA